MLYHERKWKLLDLTNAGSVFNCLRTTVGHVTEWRQSNMAAWRRSLGFDRSCLNSKILIISYVRHLVHRTRLCWSENDIFLIISLTWFCRSTTPRKDLNSYFSCYLAWKPHRKQTLFFRKLLDSDLLYIKIYIWWS